MSKRCMTKAEHNAILTGLRMLQANLRNVPASLMLILMDGINDSISADEIDELVEAINFHEVKLKIEE